ncbi:hypothetical protein GW17_00036980, partial [Ensete ventricosum]
RQTRIKGRELVVVGRDPDQQLRDPSSGKKVVLLVAQKQESKFRHLGGKVKIRIRTITYSASAVSRLAACRRAATLFWLLTHAKGRQAITYSAKAVTRLARG